MLGGVVSAGGFGRLQLGFESGFSGFRGFLPARRWLGWCVLQLENHFLLTIFTFCIHLNFRIIGVYPVLCFWIRILRILGFTWFWSVMKWWISIYCFESDLESASYLWHVVIFLHLLHLCSRQNRWLQAAAIAEKCGAEKLLIGHFSSKYEDLTPFYKEASEIFEAVEIAREGVTFRIV